MDLIDKESFRVKGDFTRSEVDDGPDVLGSEGMNGVLIRRAHPPELTQDLEVGKLRTT